MEAYVFSKNVLPIFDSTWTVITLNSAVQPVDHIKNVVTITTANGFPNIGASTPKENHQIFHADMSFHPNLLHPLSGGKDSSSPYHDPEGCMHPWVRKSGETSIYKNSLGKVLYKWATRFL